MGSFFTLSKSNWGSAWNNKSFRTTIILECLALILLLFSTVTFYRWLEVQKEGVILDDVFLRFIPALDVSMPIAILEASVFILCILRSVTNPNLAITILFALALQFSFRLVTIDLTRFLPPPGLVELKDPFGSMAFHSRYITRDLFYSGHTSSQFIFYLCARKKYDRYYMLFTTITIGIMVLIQHVHYTIDVVSAPFFAFACYFISVKALNYFGAYTELGDGNRFGTGSRISRPTA